MNPFKDRRGRASRIVLREPRVQSSQRVQRLLDPATDTSAEPFPRLLTRGEEKAELRAAASH